MTSKARNERLQRVRRLDKLRNHTRSPDEMMMEADEMREEQMRTDERYEQDSHGMWHFTG